mmetsp:Transcript_17310/g.67327  ORF Transcript_17310/g.67327 Transcript_17310/m.67327 type:complete len:226 (-) Transcript_17310:63-740(-)
MGGLFSSNSGGGQQRVTAHDRAVLDLKTQRDKLRAYTKKTQALIEKETAMAKRLAGEGKKKQALLVLKRRRYQQSLLVKSQKLLDNIQELVDGIEFASMQAQVFRDLKTGAQTLKDIQAQVDLGELEDIMCDTEDAMQKQEEIDELLSGRLTAADEEAVLAELAALQEAAAPAAAAEPYAAPDATPELPEVPQHEPEAPLAAEDLPASPTAAPEAAGERRQAQLA